MYGADGKWRKLSQNYFNQPIIYNDNPVQGGIKRSYKLLSDDVVESPVFKKILGDFTKQFSSIGPGTVVLAQLQTTTEWATNGDVTEQGIHTDGADVAMIVCLERKNVMEGTATNTLYEDVKGERIVMGPQTLEEAEAVFWIDSAIYHDVTNISPKFKENGPAVRTVLLLHADASFLLDGIKNEKNNLPGRNIWRRFKS